MQSLEVYLEDSLSSLGFRVGQNENLSKKVTWLI